MVGCNRTSQRFVCPNCGKSIVRTFNQEDVIGFNNINTVCECGDWMRKVIKIEKGTPIYATPIDNERCGSGEFRLSHISEINLQKNIRMYHETTPNVRCNAESLEHKYYDALLSDPTLKKRVIWNPHSHDTQKDILLKGKPKETPDITLGIKSGFYTNKYKDTIRELGARNTKWDGDLNKISESLRSCVSDVMIVTIHDKCDISYYQVYYIYRKIFIYPTRVEEWEPIFGIRGEKRGQIVGYQYRAPNGVITKLSISRSWQVEWDIPVSLCVPGIRLESYMKRIGSKNNVNKKKGKKESKKPKKTHTINTQITAPKLKQGRGRPKKTILPPYINISCLPQMCYCAGV